MRSDVDEYHNGRLIMLYRYRSICFLLYNFCLFAAAGSSNGSGVTSSNGSPVGSLVRKDSSPIEMVPVVTFPDSPPQHTILNLSAVGRIQSNSSIASQLSARYKEQLDKIMPTTPVDSVRLKEEFDRDVEIHLPKVTPTEVATVILTSSAGAQHSSSDDDTDGSSSKSDRYVKLLEGVIDGQDKQLRVFTNVDVHNRLRWEVERHRRAEEDQRWQEERQRLQADNKRQLMHTVAGYILAAIGLVGMGVQFGTSSC